MKSRFATTLGLAGVLLAGSIVTATAQVPAGAQDDAPVAKGERHAGKRHGGGRFGKGRGFGHMGAALGLTDAQKQQIKSIFEAEKAKGASVHQQLAENHRAMAEATKAGKFDEAQIRSLAEQRAAIMTEMTVNKARVQSTIYNTVYTPEQRAKADEFAAKRAEWGGRRGEKK